MVCVYYLSRACVCVGKESCRFSLMKGHFTLTFCRPQRFIQLYYDFYFNTSQHRETPPVQDWTRLLDEAVAVVRPLEKEPWKLKLTWGRHAAGGRRTSCEEATQFVSKQSVHQSVHLRVGAHPTMGHNRLRSGILK